MLGLSPSDHRALARQVSSLRDEVAGLIDILAEGSARSSRRGAAQLTDLWDSVGQGARSLADDVPALARAASRSAEVHARRAGRAVAHNPGTTVAVALVAAGVVAMLLAAPRITDGASRGNGR